MKILQSSAYQSTFTTEGFDMTCCFVMRMSGLESPLRVLLKYARMVGVSTDVLIDDELDLPAKLSAKPK